MVAITEMVTLSVAYARYQDIRPRLPKAQVGGESTYADSLLETIDDYDGYLFDSFGVLNVGETAIKGASDCLSALRRMGKPFCVLTNAASYTSDAAYHKYRRLGLDVRREEIVSSRDVALAQLDDVAPGLRWAAISDHGDRFEDTSAKLVDLLSSDDGWSSAEGILFLSSARWDQTLQDRLVAELIRHPRPVVVGNPDLSRSA